MLTSPVPKPGRSEPDAQASSNAVAKALEDPRASRVETSTALPVAPGQSVHQNASSCYAQRARATDLVPSATGDGARQPPSLSCTTSSVDVGITLTVQQEHARDVRRIALSDDPAERPLRTADRLAAPKELFRRASGHVEPGMPARHEIRSTNSEASRNPQEEMSEREFRDPP